MNPTSDTRRFEKFVLTHGHGRDIFPRATGKDTTINRMFTAVSLTASCAQHEVWMGNTEEDPKGGILSVQDFMRYHEAVTSITAAQNISAAQMRHSIAMKLTPKTDKAILSAAKQAGAWVVKVWPDGVTFSETGGFTDFNVMYPAIQAAAEAGFVIALHCEQPGGNIDTYAREETFLEKALRPLVADFPGARFNIEHVSTRRMLEFVGEQPANITAGITLHHAISTRNDVLEWRPQKSGRTGLNPWNHCRPPLQTFDDRDAIQRVVLNADQTANRKFHFGPDSALHLGPTKLCSCGCPGVFSIPTLAALVVELFEQNGKLDHPAFRAFTVENGAAYAGITDLDPNNTFELVREPWEVPLLIGGAEPFYAGRTISWKPVDPILAKEGELQRLHDNYLMGVLGEV